MKTTQQIVNEYPNTLHLGKGVYCDDAEYKWYSQEEVEQLQKELKEALMLNIPEECEKIIDDVFNNFKGNNLKCVFCGEPVKNEGHLSSDVCLKCFIYTTNLVSNND